MKSKRKSVFFCTIVLLLLFIVALACFSLIWALNTFADLTLDKIVIQLSLSLDGVSTDFYYSALLWVILPSVLIVAIAAFVLIKTRPSAFFTKILVGLTAVSMVTLGIALWVAWDRFEAGDYLLAKYSTFVDDNYVDPKSVKLSFPEEKRNLIYIYLESVETTFADKKSGGAFDFNCIPELTDIAMQNENFSGDSLKLNGGYPLSGATWTIGAMFAHMSGLPMKNVSQNEMRPDAPFFPNVTNLGDILEENGYNNLYLLGSDSDFGGRTGYFTTHGNYAIHDLKYAYDAGWVPNDYHVWWGFEDHRLFDFAKTELLRLSQQEEPFNLVMLTVDTHFEDGYICELCKDDFPGNQYANVMACSSRQVSEFIHWAQQQDFYDNTSIVIIGDHTTMDRDFCSEISDQYNRRVYTAFINAAAESTGENRIYSTMDMFPTTLAALGVEIPGNRLGLGTNLFSSERTLCEKYGTEQVDSELKQKSALIDKLLTIDEDTINSKINITKILNPDNTLQVEIVDTLVDQNNLSVVLRSDAEKAEVLDGEVVGNKLKVQIDLNRYEPDDNVYLDVSGEIGGKMKKIRSIAHKQSLGNVLDDYMQYL